MREDFEQKVVDLRDAFDADEECDVSLGSAWRSGSFDVDLLVAEADEQMYAEKQLYYHSVLSAGRGVRTGVATEVLREIEEGNFVVFYQPQFDIRSGRIIGAEALVRKKGEGKEIIPPDRFVPFYEIEGVIRHLDLHVLDCVCRTMKDWRGQGIEMGVAVNFSRLTLAEPGILSTVLEICGRHGVSPKNITIEVTESISRIDSEKLKLLLQEISDTGFTVSLDDFGSRYSNLSMLTKMDFDEIKFDKSLVDELEKNHRSRVVVRNAIQMCHGLEDVSSLAEGIETQGQLDLLADYNCRYGQGYYFSKPVPLEEFNELLGRYGHGEKEN